MPETKIKQRTIQVREFPVFSMESLKWLMAILVFLGGLFGTLWTWQKGQDNETKQAKEIADRNTTVLTEHVKQSEKTFDEIKDALHNSTEATIEQKTAVVAVQAELKFAKENRDRIERDLQKVCDDLEKHSHPTP